MNKKNYEIYIDLTPLIKKTEEIIAKIIFTSKIIATNVVIWNVKDIYNKSCSAYSEGYAIYEEFIKLEIEKEENTKKIRKEQIKAKRQYQEKLKLIQDQYATTRL